MSTISGDQLWALLISVLVGAILGYFVPRLIAAVPEPTVEPGTGSPKILYVDLAQRPGLAPRTAFGTAVASGVIGGSLGMAAPLPVLLLLAPIGVALAVIDWHTTLLPTRIIAPTYALVVLGIVTAGLAAGDLDAILRAALGWVVMGGFFVVLWLIYPRGLGYGDVRLSGVLGLALGFVGWSTLVVGMYGAFLIGGLGGALLGMLKIVDRKRFPFGPFMLLAAVVGIALGPPLASAVGY